MSLSGPSPAVDGKQPRTRLLRQLLLGVVAAGLAAWLGMTAISSLRRAQPPPGWRTVGPALDVMSLALDGQTLWIGAKQGLAAVDARSGEAIALPSPVTRPVYALLADGPGRLWVGHEDGLLLLSPAGRQDSPPGRSGLSGAILSLAADAAGGLWVGTANGLFRWDGAGFTRVALPADLRESPIHALFLDGQNGLWVGSGSPTHGGLCRLAEAVWECFSVAQGLAHPAVNAITADRQGNVWLATGFASRGGASRHSPGGFVSLTRRDGLAGEKVRVIYADSRDRLWFGSEYDGLAIVRDGQAAVHTDRSGLCGNEVRAIVETPDGGFWIGTNEGLTRIEPEAAATLPGKHTP